ncbi:MAG: sigma-54-dependent transcriptional regulator [Verrucomicrobiales bacterium]
MPASILIVDDEKNTRDGLRLSLEDTFDVYIAGDAAEALAVLKSEPIDVMLTDLRLGMDDGMKLLESAAKLSKPPVSVMMTAYGSVDTAVEAMKRGAYDFITKPLNLDELELLLKRALKERRLEAENTRLHAQAREREGFRKLLGRSPAIKSVLEIIEQVAPTKATVLVEGESGTGKELAAQALHHLSGRPANKLVVVHCAALSPQILESELFGHEKGAFTGASERRIGRFEQAHGGTLFLDEIGEIDPTVQVKLLRALGERVIERVGGNTSIPIDVRLVVATNRNLASMVAEGKFREDLYYRLKVVGLKMPPLRDRPDDILLLAQAFLTEFARENGKPERALSSEARDALLHYPWPGNVRELRTAMEHGVVLAREEEITPADLPPGPGGRNLTPMVVLGPDSPNVSDSGLAEPRDFNLHKAEDRLIRAALAKTGQNRTEAARLLGISRRTLQRKLKEPTD